MDKVYIAYGLFVVAFMYFLNIFGLHMKKTGMNRGFKEGLGIGYCLGGLEKNLEPEKKDETDEV